MRIANIRAAAEKGDARAQIALGDLLYQGGDGVSRDMGGAAAWFRKAAEQNDDDAQIRMARLYLQGRGVRKDRVRAGMWAMLAAAQGGTAARRELDTIARSMTLEDVEKAKQLALEWRRNH
jgi:TPR repeat protein